MWTLNKAPWENKTELHRWNLPKRGGHALLAPLKPTFTETRALALRPAGPLGAHGGGRPPPGPPRPARACPRATPAQQVSQTDQPQAFLKGFSLHLGPALDSGMSSPGRSFFSHFKFREGCTALSLSANPGTKPLKFTRGSRRSPATRRTAASATRPELETGAP